MAHYPFIKVGTVDVLMRQLRPPVIGENGYDGPETQIKTLPAGHRRTIKSKPFTVETIWEKNVNIPLRDGTILRGDIFRPVTSDGVPAIIPWSPYGKSGRG
jgi:uncharacterized protein